LAGRKEKIRDQFAVVIDPKKAGNTFDSFKAYVKGQNDGGKPTKRISFFEQKLKRWGSTQSAAPYISPREWQALQTVVFIPPSPEGLKEKALSFFKEALKLIKDDAYHPYQITAFLHYGLTSLHLFEDANGRLSRLIANIYLMQNGYEPFYVVDDSSYVELYKKDPYDVHFGQFLLSTDRLIN
jgi:Fic family protein